MRIINFLGEKQPGDIIAVFFKELARKSFARGLAGVDAEVAALVSFCCACCGSSIARERVPAGVSGPPYRLPTEDGKEYAFLRVAQIIDDWFRVCDNVKYRHILEEWTLGEHSRLQMGYVRSVHGKQSEMYATAVRKFAVLKRAGEILYHIGFS
jgi:hypothetical protein